jgi:uncharacterized membrane protein YbhN (UPF0104 family)
VTIGIPVPGDNETVESVHSFLDAVHAFGDGLAAVSFTALAIAIGLHVSNLVLRSRAWFNILRAAYPGAVIRWRRILGAYAAGVGINAIAPARGGDVVKIYAVRQSIEGSSTPTIVSSLLAETVFDMVIATTLLAWAYSSGGLPSLPDLPNAPAFEFAFIGDHQREVLIAAGVLALIGMVLLRWVTKHVRAFWDRVRQGLAILHFPKLYLRRVALLQFIGWWCRLGTAYYLLEAFHVNATIENALLVLVVGSISTLLPFTPGGAGAQQALLVIVLSGEAARSTILAYSVGAQISITVVNVIIGFVSLFLLFGGLRWSNIAHRADPPAEPEPKPG